jgi:hypothetical protein
MPEDKSLGSKLLGLFVDVGDGTPSQGTPPVESKEKSAAELVAELASQSDPRKAPATSPAPRSPSTTATQGPIPGASGPVTPATVDFDAVFRNAGMDPSELDRVRKAEELLKGLPESTPKDVKRQIVEASLKAFGFDVQKIGLAAQAQLKAVDTWVRVTEQQTAKGLADAQAQIAQLEDKVISLRADITKRGEQQAAMAAAADQRRSQVGKVLEFFQPAPPASPAGPGKP